MTDLQIKCFLALADHLNFTRAAADLSLAQPTLSAHIRALERNVGFPLFRRNRRTVTLSPEGTALLDGLRRASACVDEGLAAARVIHERQQNTLRVACIPSIISNHELMHLMGQFRTQEPGITIQLQRMHNAEIIRAFRQDRIDLAFSLDKVLDLDDTLEGYPILHSYVSLVASSERLRKRGELRLEDFQDEPLFLISKEVDPTDAGMLRRLREEYGYRPSRIDIFSSIESLSRSVALGLGVTISDHVSFLFDQPIFRHLDFEEYRVTAMVIYRRQQQHPALQLFVDYIQQHFPDLAAQRVPRRSG